MGNIIDRKRNKKFFNDIGVNGVGFLLVKVEDFIGFVGFFRFFLRLFMLFVNIVFV